MPESNCSRDNSTTVDILRHGEVAGRVCFRGSSDTALTKIGRQQMLQAVAHLDSLDAIISSPLSRCHSFACDVASSRQIPLEIMEDLAEINFGDWEQKTAEEINQTDPEALMKFYQDPTFRPPGNGECQNDFYQRTVSVWQMLLSKYAQQHILLITHAGVMRMIFSHALGIPLQNTFNIQIKHACLSRFYGFHSDTEKFMQLSSHKNPYQ